MGSVQSHIHQDNTKALAFFQKHELDEMVQIFEELSNRKTLTNTTTHAGIDKETFGEYFPYPGILCEQIFKVFDSNKDGFINREEFLRGVAMCCRGPLQEKLKFCFQMFDISGDGKIDREELAKCLQSTAFASFRLLHTVNQELESLEKHYSSSLLEEDNQEVFDIDTIEFEEDIAIMVNAAFEKCDLNADNCLSIDEFRMWMLCTPDVVRILYSVFAIHQQVDMKDIQKEFLQASTMKEDEATYDAHIKLAEKRLSLLIEESNALSRQAHKLRVEERQLEAHVHGHDHQPQSEEKKSTRAILGMFQRKNSFRMKKSTDYSALRQNECDVDEIIAPEKVTTKKVIG